MRNDINVFAEEYAKHKSTITKEDLNIAVEKEDYITAAKIRDTLNA